MATRFECAAAYLATMSAPIECPTSTNGSVRRSERIVACSAASCSSMVYSASGGAGDPPKPRMSIAMVRWLSSSSGIRFWKVTEDEAIPWTRMTTGPEPVSLAMWSSGALAARCPINRSNHHMTA